MAAPPSEEYIMIIIKILGAWFILAVLVGLFVGRVCNLNDRK